MSVAADGRTRVAHVRVTMDRAEELLSLAFSHIRFQDYRLGPASRKQLRRDLAGVIADCETLRVWLDAGAPR
jgi:hypothetical protein